MRLPVLALDVDECLFPFLDQYRHWLVDQGRPTFQVEDMQGFGVGQLLGMAPDEAKDLEMRFVDEASWDVAPMGGATAAVAELSRYYELHAVTARVEDRAGPATRAWLDRWFPDAFAGTHLLWDSLGAPVRPKGQICAQLGALALVDDSPGNLATLDGTATRGVLLGRWPWTWSVRGPWHHAQDWPDAVAHLCP